MTPPGTGRLAWRDADIVMVSAAALVCVIAIASAWFGAARAGSVAAQAAWLQVGVAGFAVFAGGACLWLLRGRRAVGERRSGLISLDDRLVDKVPADSPAAGTRGGPGSTASYELVRSVGMTRVHLPECPLLAGKRVEPATFSDGPPCGVCHE